MLVRDPIFSGNPHRLLEDQEDCISTRYQVEGMKTAMEDQEIWYGRVAPNQTDMQLQFFTGVILF